MTRPRRESWAPGKAAALLRAGIESEYATIYLEWAYLSLGWRAFAELEAQRVARGWGGIEVFAWRAEYGGAFLTLRRVW